MAWRRSGVRIPIAPQLAKSGDRKAPRFVSGDSFLAESQSSVLAFWVGLAAGLIGLWFLVRVWHRLGEVSGVVLQQPPARLTAAHDRPAAVAERAQEAGAVGNAEQAGHAHAEVRA